MVGSFPPPLLVVELTGTAASGMQPANSRLNRITVKNKRFMRYLLL